VRGEILFGIARLPAGRRRLELEEIGHRFLAAFHCEPIPERAAGFYADLKLAQTLKQLARSTARFRPESIFCRAVVFSGLRASCLGASVNSGNLLLPF
jgi:hypothetical protein